MPDAFAAVISECRVSPPMVNTVATSPAIELVGRTEADATSP